VSSPPQFKVCPECRVEYRLSAEVCVDCRVPLVHAEVLPAEEALAEFPPADQLACVRVAPLAWIQALSMGLQEQGVTLRVERARAEDAPDGQRADNFGDVGQLFGLYVRSEKLELARELDGSIAALLLPEDSAPLEEGEVDACPACGDVLAADALECPGCGLGFA
jgi:hypothetical protein